MAYELREGQGSLFRNERKEQDSHPGMTGTALIGGVEYWVSSWKKEGKKGPWLSLAFKPKVPAPPPVEGNMGDAIDDEIVF